VIFGVVDEESDEIPSLSDDETAIKPHFKQSK
jgi:hypothetical protein